MSKKNKAHMHSKERMAWSATVDGAQRRSVAIAGLESKQRVLRTKRGHEWPKRQRSTGCAASVPGPASVQKAGHMAGSRPALQTYWLFGCAGPRLAATCQDAAQ